MRDITLMRSCKKGQFPTVVLDKTQELLESQSGLSCWPLAFK